MLLMSEHSDTVDERETPSIDILGRSIVDQRRGSPLHVQVRRTLKALIDERFEHGQLFWPEKQIAERLGVSRGTIRQALGDLTREGLLLRQHAIGSFVCKNAAASIALTTVSLFISHYESDFLKEMLAQLAAACRNRRLRMEVYDTQKGELISNMYRQVERPPTEQGVILMLEPRATLELYTAFNDRNYRTVSIEPTPTDYPGASIETDSSVVVRIGVEYLTSLGHQRIVLLVNEPVESPSVQMKIRAFNEMKQAGKIPSGDVVVCGAKYWDNSYQAAYAHMEEVWLLRPSAIFAVSDSGAWAALKWLDQHNIEVPGQVSVLGFENSVPSRYVHPPLTTIAHPVVDLAQGAVDMLIDGSLEHVYLPPKLIVRDSVAPPA